MKKHNNMFFKLFTTAIYVKVYRNKIVVKNVIDNNEITLSATKPFTTTRLLVGEFVEAESLLKEALRKIYKNKWFSPSPFIVIQPMEMIDGGLSEIETKVMHELASAAGAREVFVWEGKNLSNEEVIKKINS